MRGSNVPEGLFLVRRRASVGGLGATEASRTAVGAAHAAAAAAHAYVCMLSSGPGRVLQESRALCVYVGDVWAP